MYHTTTSHSWPTAHIAVNRNRVKHYDKHVYLKGGTHFEIELFNPLQDKVLAKISIDGTTISTGGIVVKPGQRVFLERWINQAKKFLFETYELDNSEEAKQAAWQNGIIKVEFYRERRAAQVWTAMPVWTTGSIAYLNDTSNFTYGGSTVNNTVYLSTTASVPVAGSLETGRTEMGASSNQGFSSDFGDYESFAVTTETIQILPESLKPVEVSQIRNYCSGCGNRIKKTSWKFCPSCGTEI